MGGAGNFTDAEVRFLLVVGFPSGAFAANCYLVARAAGEACVLVDPGQGSAEGIAAAVAEHRLTPAAVLATHGHFDHVAEADIVADTYRVPVHLRPEDHGLLTDPWSGASAQLVAALGDALRAVRPAEVVELADGPLELAGLRIVADHTPGHTPGSAIFRFDGGEHGAFVVSGDTLFAGSIGRTDLPGGSVQQIQQSLRDKLLTLSSDTVVLPGHGGPTTIGRERAGNPFLRELQVTRG